MEFNQSHSTSDPRQCKVPVTDVEIRIAEREDLECVEISYRKVDQVVFSQVDVTKNGFFEMRSDMITYQHRYIELLALVVVDTYDKRTVVDLYLCSAKH